MAVEPVELAVEPVAVELPEVAAAEPDDEEGGAVEGGGGSAGRLVVQAGQVSSSRVLFRAQIRHFHALDAPTCACALALGLLWPPPTDECAEGTVSDESD